MSTIRIEHEVVIRRPRADVFAFVSDQEHLPAWTSGVSRAKRTTSGPIGVGTTYAVVGRTLGRRIESTYEVIEFEPPTGLVSRIESPLFSIEETYAFDGDGPATTIRLTADATARGFLRVLGPVLGLAVDRQIRADHNRLKTILERRRRRKAAAEKPPTPELAPEAVTEESDQTAEAVREE